MSTSSELWKKWEGRVVDQKFPLRQWLGGSDHSAVFLTERGGDGSQKTAIKLIAADKLDADAQLSHWAAAAKFSHRHVIRLFEFGRCVIDDTPLLYVVMEYADENLGQILPVRPLSAGEASEMLRPAAEALASLHRSGVAHGSIRPSNIMAVDNQLKLSADTLGKVGDRNAARGLNAYDAPEVAISGPSPAADMWALGVALVAVLTQNEPKVKNAGREPIIVPSTIAQPFREIARECLRDEQHRCTAEDILRRLQPAATAEAKNVELHAPPDRSNRWVVVTIVVAALLLGVWLGIRVLSHQASVPAANTGAATDAPAEKSPAPFSEKQQPAKKGVTRGSVFQQVMPEISRGAQNTITGRIKVSAQVEVDASGKVSQAKLVSAGPSRYFADRALAAARRWKFTPPQVDGRPVASEWLLRFQIGRASTQAFPVETKP